MSIRHSTPLLLLAGLVTGAGCGADERTADAGDAAVEETAVEETAVEGMDRYEPARVDLTATAEATSLLGEPLYPIVADSATTTRLHAQLDSAVAVYAAQPDDPDALIWLGRRYAYAGHYRDAIDAFTEGVRQHPEDARFYRHRGHRYITVRELDRAIDDLEHAARLISGADDQVEPDGMPNDSGVPRSTLHTNVWYHLGLARYIQHDFEGAAHAFGRGHEISPNDDMRVAMADWLWLALKRLGRDGEAAALLDEISPDMEILENDAYLHRLLAYKGELTPDSLIGGSLVEADPLMVATHGYGLGAWRLVQGDTAGAGAAFRRVLESAYWPAFGYIAAEADLRALDGDGTDAVDPQPTSRQ